jgi:hypothetical protein
MGNLVQSKLVKFMAAMLRIRGLLASQEAGLFCVFQAKHVKNEGVRYRVVRLLERAASKRCGQTTLTVRFAVKMFTA